MTILKIFCSLIIIYGLVLCIEAFKWKDYAIYNPDGCKIPNFDPFDPSYKHLFAKVEKPVCSDKPPASFVRKQEESNIYEVLIDDDVISENYDASENYECWYNIVRRHPVKRDQDVELSASYPINNKSALPRSTEFIIVTCQDLLPKSNSRLRRPNVWYKNAHAVIPDKKTVQDRLRSFRTRNPNYRPVSMLLIAIDSISRMNLKRSMPKTAKYLHDNDWIELRGYNKIGESTYPNEVALLTGLPPSDNTCNPLSRHGLNECPFIWKKFSSKGYVTAFGEDNPAINTFNYRKQGFYNQPTDYYMRPFFLSMRSHMAASGIKDFFCTGPVEAARRIYDYALNFTSKFNNDPYFALFWTNSFSHEIAGMPRTMDIETLTFLDDLKENGAQNSSVIFFFSDHGIRRGESFKSYTGYYELRLPFFFASFPPWFKEMYPKLMKDFRINANRLTTPYDVYSTLLHLLTINEDKRSMRSAKCCSESNSLLEPIDSSRTCKEARIEPQWCTCGEFLEHDDNGLVLKEMALSAVDHLNEFGQSKNITLHRVLFGRSTDGTLSNTFENVIVFETTPGYKRYEAIVSRNKHDKFNIVDKIRPLIAEE